METKKRYLTKTRFILGLECPSKLFYYGKKEYPNRKAENEFLLSLADGGYQVGELARYYHPGGIAVETLDYDQAITETDLLLEKENVIIYEAAFRCDTLFVRADVLIKKGNRIELVEVKAKSFSTEEEFFNAGGDLSSKWEHYLQDVAFQKYVICRAKPAYRVHAYLMVADKKAEATVDGLNQKFFITRDAKNRRSITVIGDTDCESLGKPVLVKVDVNDIADRIIAGSLFKTDYASELMPVDVNESTSFENAVKTLARRYSDDIKISSPLGAKCKNCEYMTLPEEDEKGLRNGFRECWKEEASFTDENFKEPLVLDVWNWRKRTQLIEKGVYFQKELSDADFPDLNKKKKTKTGSQIGLTGAERQYLQVTRSVKHDTSPYLDKEYIRNEFATFVYPLHMIDFETSMVAIPFHRGRHPYEQIAFQFSHHIIEENGLIRHAGEYIASEKGKFPNFDFVRALKKELEEDNGTVFRYANHENTVLNQIRQQLLMSKEPDRDMLVSFIETVTHEKDADGYSRAGARDMYDMLELVKKAYYHISMKGSNSIKYVLPAILNSSEYLQNKYSKPIYGNEISSFNFRDFTVVEMDTLTGLVKNPYHRLLPVLDGLDAETLNGELLYDDSEIIKEGGAAAVAFGRMQYTDMTDAERTKVKQSLLRYCELDTLAMVLVWEYFKKEIE